MLKLFVSATHFALESCIPHLPVVLQFFSQMEPLESGKVPYVPGVFTILIVSFLATNLLSV